MIEQGIERYSRGIDGGNMYGGMEEGKRVRGGDRECAVCIAPTFSERKLFLTVNRNGLTAILKR